MSVSLDKMSKLYSRSRYQDKCFYIKLSFIDIEKSIVQQCNVIKEVVSKYMVYKWNTKLEEYKLCILFNHEGLQLDFVIIEGKAAFMLRGFSY